MQNSQYAGIHAMKGRAWKAYCETRPTLTTKHLDKWYRDLLKKHFVADSPKDIDQFYYPHIMAMFEQIIGDDIQWTQRAQNAPLAYIRHASKVKDATPQYCEDIAEQAFKRSVPLSSMSLPQLKFIIQKLKIDAARSA